MIARTHCPLYFPHYGRFTLYGAMAVACLSAPIQEFVPSGFAQQAKTWSTSPPPPNGGPGQPGPGQPGPGQPGPGQPGHGQSGHGGHDQNHGGMWQGQHHDGQNHHMGQHGNGRGMQQHQRGVNHYGYGLREDYHGGYADDPRGYGNNGYGQGWGHAGHGRPGNGNPGWNYPGGYMGGNSGSFPGGFSGGVSVFLNPSDYGTGDPSQPGLIRSQATYYREPFPAGPDAPVATLIPTNAAAASYQQSAEAALRSSQFREAYRWVNHALVEDPRNGQLRLFQVHALTGMQSYAAANSALHQAAPFVRAGEWDSILRRQDEFFTQQDLVQILDQLNQSSTDPGVPLLIAYHLAFLDPEDSQTAIDRLSKLSDDPVANQLRVELTSGHLSRN